MVVHVYTEIEIASPTYYVSIAKISLRLFQLTFTSRFAPVGSFFLMLNENLDGNILFRFLLVCITYNNTTFDLMKGTLDTI